MKAPERPLQVLWLWPQNFGTFSTKKTAWYISAKWRPQNAPCKFGTPLENLRKTFQRGRWCNVFI